MLRWVLQLHLIKGFASCYCPFRFRLALFVFPISQLTCDSKTLLFKARRMTAANKYVKYVCRFPLSFVSVVWRLAGVPCFAQWNNRYFEKSHANTSKTLSHKFSQAFGFMLHMWRFGLLCLFLRHIFCTSFFCCCSHIRNLIYHFVWISFQFTW